MSYEIALAIKTKDLENVPENIKVLLLDNCDDLSEYFNEDCGNFGIYSFDNIDWDENEYHIQELYKWLETLPYIKFGNFPAYQLICFDENTGKIIKKGSNYFNLRVGITFDKYNNTNVQL